MFYKVGLFVALIFATVATADAAGRKLDNSVRNAWRGGATMDSCKAHSIGDTCVGTWGMSDGGNCNNNGARGPNDQKNRGTQSSQMAMLMVIARDANADCAHFCATQIQAANKKRSHAWTVYYEPAGNFQSCFWLCQRPRDGDPCDTRSFNRDAFRGAEFNTAGNAKSVEHEVMMFEWDKYHRCGGNVREEHDMVLAISRWLPSGNGAFAQQMIVRAERWNWPDQTSTATLWWAPNGKEILVCKEGFKPKGNDDCEPINPAVCSSSTTAAPLRCPAGQGFPSANDETCAPCTGNGSGVSTATGVCHHCATGQIFDGATCRTARQLSNIELRFGLGRSSAPANSTPCWMEFNVSDYRECVLGQ
ncbi:MAG: hypothetical protein FWF34_01600 [Alphaproteobacteria bacterium]|nr:hypothetical protein [Alphaproteobacteria bacterium]MCL2889932.1 hypothetical protein [Alphaproteobacteria bacterium]